jgi:hypothetical protein
MGEISNQGGWDKVPEVALTFDDGTGRSVRVSSSNPLPGTGGGSGGGGTGTEYTEDAVAATNPVGGMLIARRRDTPASEVSADGDVLALNATAKGELYTALTDGANATQGAKADATWGGSGAGSIVAILKALWAALTGAQPAGENHIGQVGGELKVAGSTPTITSGSAYASGNVIGTKMTFAGLGRVIGLTGLIQMGLLVSKSNQSFAADLILFHTDPAASTFTDKTALAVNAADFDKILGKIAFASTDWTNAGTPSFAQQTALAMAYKVATGATDIYGVLVSRGTPTFGSTSDLKVTVKALLD